MRRISEFKGKRSEIGFDAETGEFVETPLPFTEFEPPVAPFRKRVEPAMVVAFPLLASAPQQKHVRKAVRKA